MLIDYISIIDLLNKMEEVQSRSELYDIYLNLQSRIDCVKNKIDKKFLETWKVKNERKNKNTQRG